MTHSLLSCGCCAARPGCPSCRLTDAVRDIAGKSARHGCCWLRISCVPLRGHSAYVRRQVHMQFDQRDRDRVWGTDLSPVQYARQAPQRNSSANTTDRLPKHSRYTCPAARTAPLLLTCSDMRRVAARRPALQRMQKEAARLLEQGSCRNKLTQTSEGSNVHAVMSQTELRRHRTRRPDQRPASALTEPVRFAWPLNVLGYEMELRAADSCGIQDSSQLCSVTSSPGPIGHC